MNVIPSLTRYLYQTMAADPDLRDALMDAETREPRIYEAKQPTEGGQAVSMAWASPWPERPVYPLVRFKVMSVPHSRGNGGRYFASWCTVLIEGLAPGEDLLALDGVAQRLSDLFGSRAQGECAGLTISGSICQQDIDATETDDTGTHKRLGGIFQFFVFPTPAGVDNEGVA